MGWGPHQYAPIHDHPEKGCLQSVVKGPGIYEAFFKKSSENDEKTECDKSIESRMSINMTGIYECHPNLPGSSPHHADGCDVKYDPQHLTNVTKACLTELYSFNATVGGTAQVAFVSGYDLMHYVQNLNNEHTFSLHHYFGEYQIAWWLNRKVYEPDDKDFLLSTP